MLKKKHSINSISFIISMVLTSNLYANDKSFLDYKNIEKGNVQYKTSPEVESRIRKLEEENSILIKKFEYFLKENNDSNNNFKENLSISNNSNNLESQKEVAKSEEKNIFNFDYKNYRISVEAEDYYILVDSRNNRKLVSKKEFNKIISK